jgi:hypothetical protein
MSWRFGCRAFATTAPAEYLVRAATSACAAEARCDNSIAVNGDASDTGRRTVSPTFTTPAVRRPPPKGTSSSTVPPAAT